MDRGSASAFQTEIVKSQNRPVHLISVHFDEGVFYMTDAYKDLSWAGQTYIAVGSLLGFSDIEESTEVIVNSMTLSLSGVDQVWVGNFLSKTYIDRTVKIYMGFLDDNQALVSEPTLLFEGRMDSPTITENPDSGESTVSVSATNAWVDFNRQTGRHTNHEEQQIHFAGDKGFEYASEIVKDIIWGHKRDYEV